MKKILYIGLHTEIRHTVLRLINAREDWKGFGAATEEEAIALFEKEPIDVVLLGCGIAADSERRLSDLFRELRPGTAVVPHYGGGSGLLTNEILSALGQ